MGQNEFNSSSDPGSPAGGPGSSRDRRGPSAEQRAEAIWASPALSAPEHDRFRGDQALDAAILAIAANDRTCFAEIAEYLAPRTRAYLIEHGLTAVVAERIAVATMVEIWRTAAAFDPSVGSGKAWLFERLRQVALRNEVILRTSRR